MIDEAFSQAKLLDEERTNGKLRSELHGIPMSLKNNVMLKGYDTSLGMVTRYGILEPEDAFFVTVLKAKGVIPFVKTNLPIASLGNESENYIYGRVISPFDENRSPGGSSGGESVMVKTGCSVLGVGSDNAGSVRTPALYTGICAFKFGVERMTTKGMWGLVPEDESPLNICGSEYGIITKCAEDARLASKVIHENELMYQQDPELVHRDWNNEIFERSQKLKVCYIDQTIDYQISAPNQRALQMSVDCLSARGHKVDRLTFENFADEVFNSKICLWELGKVLAPYLRHDWTINESFSLYQMNLIPP